CNAPGSQGLTPSSNRVAGDGGAVIDSGNVCSPVAGNRRGYHLSNRAGARQDYLTSNRTRRTAAAVTPRIDGDFDFNAGNSLGGGALYRAVETSGATPLPGFDVAARSIQ